MFLYPHSSPFVHPYLIADAALTFLLLAVGSVGALARLPSPLSLVRTGLCVHSLVALIMVPSFVYALRVLANVGLLLSLNSLLSAMVSPCLSIPQ